VIEQQKVSVAALVHDLRALLSSAKLDPARYPSVRVLIEQAEAPDLAPVLNCAERYAAPQTTPFTATQPLTSVFSLVALEQAAPATVTHRLAALPNAEGDLAAVFPNGSTTENDNFGRHVARLFEALDQTAATVPAAHLDSHLLTVLQRYAWCLPCHTPDLAFFDHARLASAIAACLRAYHGAGVTSETLSAAEGDTRFVLVVGDLSGIQDYIFSITTIGAGGVARRLRARSFYLSAVSEAISHHIALHFGLPLGNVIMASGGKFYVLLPNAKNIEERLQSLRQKIDSWFLERFNGEVAVNLAHRAFSGSEFQASRQNQPGFGRVLAELSRQLNREKSRRSQSVLTQPGEKQKREWKEDAFLIKRDFWGKGACMSCGKFPAERAENLCLRCEQDVALGKRLPQARYVAYYRPGQSPTGAFALPLDYAFQVFASRDELAQAGEPYLLFKLNDPDLHELANYPATFRYLANHVPTGKSFEEIAAASDGRRLLGYVKADVDRLGAVFAHGLRRDEGGYDTAAHSAALSRELDVFFSGWVQNILSRKAEYRDFYTIFSGGDDLFLVGPWSKAAALAQYIREQFTAFIGRNPDLTLSAGVLFAKERYPISRAAHDAEEALEHSKEREWVDAGGARRTRNQLTVLGQTLNWETAPAIFAEIEMLQARSEKLTSAFLYDLIEYSRLYRQWAEERKIEGLRYRPLFAYNIARNLKKKDAELFRWADALMQALPAGQPSLTLKYLGLIATYMLFARRSR
jgi:CRISPR-associated protein Csm1